jgi:hypothetical protein
MAEMNQMAEAQPDYEKKKPNTRPELSDEEDNVADFLEVRLDLNMGFDVATI